MKAHFVQLDEPVLSELAFAPANTRTFMCAALAARKDPAEELEFAVTLINRVLSGIDRVRTGVHVCRGNWSRDETTLLRGGYQPLAPYFARFQARQLVLEYATERAGDLMAFPGKELGLGVVNPRIDEVETAAGIRRRSRPLAHPRRADLSTRTAGSAVLRPSKNTQEIAVGSATASAAKDHGRRKRIFVRPRWLAID